MFHVKHFPPDIRRTSRRICFSAAGAAETAVIPIRLGGIRFRVCQNREIYGRAEFPHFSGVIRAYFRTPGDT
jgi:hypothetical protein